MVNDVTSSFLSDYFLCIQEDGIANGGRRGGGKKFYLMPRIIIFIGKSVSETNWSWEIQTIFARVVPDILPFLISGRISGFI